MNLKIAVATVALFTACSGITDPACSCSPPGGGSAVITGLVLDSDASPVQNAAVKLRLMQDESCAEFNPPMVRTEMSGAGGGFRHVQSWSGGKKCFSVWAEPPAGSTLADSEQQIVRIDFADRVVPDSVNLVLSLR